MNYNGKEQKHLELLPPPPFPDRTFNRQKDRYPLNLSVGKVPRHSQSTVHVTTPPPFVRELLFKICIS